MCTKVFSVVYIKMKTKVFVTRTRKILTLASENILFRLYIVRRYVDATSIDHLITRVEVTFVMQTPVYMLNKVFRAYLNFYAHHNGVSWVLPLPAA